MFISRQFIQLPGIAVNVKDSWKLWNDLLLKVHGIVVILQSLIPILHIAFNSEHAFYPSNSAIWGSLVVTGRRTSSLLRYHPRIFPSRYNQYDKEFRDTCCGIADLCDLYQKRRPPDTCEGYEPPVWCKLLRSK